LVYTNADMSDTEDWTEVGTAEVTVTFYPRDTVVAKELEGLKAQLERDFRQRQEQLDQKQNQVVKLKEELESQGMMLSEAARREKGMQFQQAMGELQQLYMTLQQELAQKEAEATKRIFDKMRTIIAEIGKEQSYTMVLERTESAVLYDRDGLDLTDELIKRFNALK
jgi:outer membrane protein